MSQIYRTVGATVAALIIGLGLMGSALAQGGAQGGGAAQSGPGAGTAGLGRDIGFGGERRQ